jgi:hypothetical protein
MVDKNLFRFGGSLFGHSVPWRGFFRERADIGDSRFPCVGLAYDGREL